MIAIIIPAYNEEKTIANVIRKSKKYGKVIVVDDASSDRTASVARKSGARVISHGNNKGLGSALRTGFREAIRMKSDFVVTIDADGQHRPEEIRHFVDVMNQGYDFVLGRRNLSYYPFVKRFGNFFLNNITNFVSNTDLKDTESGFRAIRTDALKKMYLRANRYEIAVEIVFEAGRNRLRTANVPVSSPRYVKGVGVKDGVGNFLYLMRRRKRDWRSYLDDFVYVMRKKL